MICPLMSKIESPVFSPVGKRIVDGGFSPTECVEGNCEWFDREQGRCFVPVIAVNLEALRSTIRFKNWV